MNIQLDNLNKKFNDNKLELSTDGDDFTELFLHFLIEKNKANNNFIREFVIISSEFGGSCYIESKKKKIDKDYNDKLKEKINEIKEKEIDLFIQASTTGERYEYIKNNIFHTKEDKYILASFNIMHKFKLKQLSKHFLMDLGVIDNIEKFRQSTLYIATDKYKYKFLQKYTDYEKNKILKKIEYIENITGMFFDNIFDNIEKTVYGGSDGVLDEEN